MAVDLSADAVRATRAIFSRCFPRIGFEAVVGDAAHFTELGIGKFDAICIDLYDAAGYPRFVFTEEFWLRIRSALAPDGVVLVNAWGLPAHPHWSAGPSAQSRLARVVSSVFTETSDAVTFVLAALILAAPVAVRAEPGRQPVTADAAPAGIWRQRLGRPRWDGPGITRALGVWGWFSVVGAAVNAIELPVFTVVHHFGARGFGYGLACYGVGGLIAFGISQPRPRWEIPPSRLAAA